MKAIFAIKFTRNNMSADDMPPNEQFENEFKSFVKKHGIHIEKFAYDKARMFFDFTTVSDKSLTGAVCDMAYDNDSSAEVYYDEYD